MSPALLDTVVLLVDLPSHGLCAGDLGAVAHVHDARHCDVEFVTAAGQTQAVVTLETNSVRAIRDEDLLAVRTLPVRRGVA